MSGGGAGGWIESTCGWIESTYDRSKFKMNKRREADLLSLVSDLHADIEKFKCAEDDMKDVLLIIKLLKNNEINAAIQYYKNLDTAARDNYPQWMGELVGVSFNPSYWREENTLEATD